METLGVMLGAFAVGALVAFGAWALVEAIRVPGAVYRSIGTRKWMWIIFILWFGPISLGVVAFVVAIRPRLQRQISMQSNGTANG